MSKISNILNELFMNEAKYTKASLKKDIENGKVTGYISWDEPIDTGSTTGDFKSDKIFRKVVLGNTPNTKIEDGNLVIGTSLMKGDMNC